MTRPGIGPCGTNLAGNFQHVGHAGSASHGTFTGALDHGPIGQGIAEGNAEFNHVGAGIDCGERDVARDFDAGIAGRQIDDQAWFVIEAKCH